MNKTVDMHMHSNYSFDAKYSMGEMANAAYEHGASVIAFTEHWDTMKKDSVYWDEGSIPYYTSHKLTRDAELENVREKMNGKLEIIRGIELGQPYVDPSMADTFLDDNDFDFVIGSVHHIESGLDYYYIDYDKVDIDKTISGYYTDHYKLIEYGKIDTVAHLDYPVRLLEGHLKAPASMERYKDIICEILKKIIEKKIALEINTYGLRGWFNRYSPEPFVLQMYRDLGGKNVTIGSDAHIPMHTAFGADTAISAAEELGLRVVRSWKKHEPIF